MQRRLAAVLNADLVGYSRLMSKDEAGTLMTLKAYEMGVIDPTVAKHRASEWATAISQSSPVWSTPSSVRCPGSAKRQRKETDRSNSA